ncbi:hypothetical protein COW06_01210, partial [Candidatus Gracilibacteria bacterium CG12_big_fil_rev_8_21_14_0_65_38_15]
KRIMKLKFATGLAYFTRNSFLHNLIKFYILDNIYMSISDFCFKCNFLKFLKIYFQKIYGN